VELVRGGLATGWRGILISKIGNAGMIPNPTPTYLVYKLGETKRKVALWTIEKKRERVSRRCTRVERRHTEPDLRVFV